MNNTLRKSLLSLTVLFCAVAALPSHAENKSDLEGTWENENIGVVEIQPCKDNSSKFCGYLLETTPEAMESFQLRVDQTSQNIRGMLVMTDLDSNEDGDKLNDGRFQNTNSAQAQKAELNIKYDGEVMNVRASIGWFGENFKFKRVQAQAETNLLAKAPHTKKPGMS